MEGINYIYTLLFSIEKRKNKKKKKRKEVKKKREKGAYQ